MRQMRWKESRVLDQRVQFIAELPRAEEVTHDWDQA